MKASVIYALPEEQFWKQLTLDAPATLLSAITESGVLNLYPEIDLNLSKVGVFGKVKPLDSELCEGDRVEIYRPITFVSPSDDEDDD
ncbi:RnfH family protein [Vibrio hippocampi]|uniref:UPF0125 protein VHP8226_03176 n=1 Tax=Vibrio hippocampi TaxID=654686 RepID=A0ABM8ZN68_9VIBR|nr:RnfH family protein [Vibrio hippocampi]CAH0529351.1 hypothetical protein VHP8226_03176 [Vibrio hippocampi]